MLATFWVWEARGTWTKRKALVRRLLHRVSSSASSFIQPCNWSHTCLELQSISGKCGRRILIEFSEQSFVSIFISELSDTIMNVVGSLMWLAVGGTALHYWQGYMAAYDQVVVVQEQVVIFQFFLLIRLPIGTEYSTRLLTILFFCLPRSVWCLDHCAFCRGPCTLSTLY